MTYRPYPSVDRARRQLDRHADEGPPQPPKGYTAVTAAVAFERWSTAMRSAVPTAQQLVASWTAALKPRPVRSEEKTT